jgi:NAD(P)-dependent dehydrogenase (short-subunit alcohol dehydrogenase family)
MTSSGAAGGAARQLLQDRVALVTGAGRGWGRAICLAFARQGAQVIAAARTQSELDLTAGLVRVEGGRVETLCLDVAREAELQRAASDLLARYGRLDVLVNNAAQLPRIPFEAMPMEAFDRVLAVNLRAPILLCKLFLEPMKQQGRGSLINVSSNAGVRGFESESAYCTSKFGIEGFSRALALEVKQHNIAVNTITPGGASAGMRIKPTSLTQDAYDRLSASEQAQWADSIVMTEAFVFLARQDGHGVTGERVLAYELSEQIRRQGWHVHPAADTLGPRQ